MTAKGLCVGEFTYSLLGWGGGNSTSIDKVVADNSTIYAMAHIAT